MKWNETSERNLLCVKGDGRANEEFLWSGTESLINRQMLLTFANVAHFLALLTVPAHCSPAPLSLCTVTTRHSHTSLCEATPYMRLLLFANGLTQCPSCPLAPLQSPGREASVRQCVRRELFVCLSVWANYNWVQWERIELRRVFSISHASAVNDEL